VTTKKKPEPPQVWLAIINTPGYLPDIEPVEFASPAAAWEYLASNRSGYEEQQTYYEARSDYTDAVRVLAHLAGLDAVHGGTAPPIPVHEAKDGQVVHYQILPLEVGPVGWVKLRCSLPMHDDYDTELGEIFTVQLKEEEQEA
jgi:hypothetical protein